jgi:YVTN family beta-propeller protein
LAAPQPVTVAVGGAATFTVTATGTSPLVYQWLRNGNPIVGAAGTSYTLSPVSKLDDQASFSVLVTNGNGANSATSASAKLTAVSPASGIELIAGQLGGAGALNGAGGAARFFQPESTAVDDAGNVYVADTYSSTIRIVSPTGAVSTLAGVAAKVGSTDGTGASALFNFPEGVAVDHSGNVYVADTLNSTIRKISPGGAVTTIAGTAGMVGTSDSPALFTKPRGVAVDSAGTYVYVADSGANTVRKIDTSTGAVSTLVPASLVPALSSPQAVAVGAAGILYVADTDNAVIRKVDASGNVTIFAGKVGLPGFAEDPSAIGVAQFNKPRALTVDVDGNVLVADTFNAVIRKITTGQIVSTLAGSVQHTNGYADGAATAALFNNPWGVTVDSAGNLYVADFGNDSIRKVAAPAAGGGVSTMAGRAPAPGSADLTGEAASFKAPQGAAVDAAGNMYIIDTGNSVIRKITAGGAVSTLAGTAGATGAVDATGAAASFLNPRGIAIDASGVLYVADTGNNTIRKVTAGGNVTTLAGIAGTTGSTDGNPNAATFNGPQALAVDTSGNVYVADTGNNIIRKITSVGVVSTFAGSGLVGDNDTPDGTPSFHSPQGVAVDAAGNVYVVDTQNYSVRMITPTGFVSTFAGRSGTAGNADGTGRLARFSQPVGITIDSVGNLYVMDSVYHIVRKVTTPGAVVTTVAGTHGDRGVQLGALPGSLNSPVGLAVLPGDAQLVVPDKVENSVLSLTLP